ncbi:hypothetical protein [Streptomyces sp. URMC 125]|uniref:hypothetical protein n=1 Tax=Streptomyces sp. URMC 125 TaxID=3423419 RepID=UPI003F1D4A8A
MIEPLHSIRNTMQEWERLANALESQWRTVDYFPLDDYLFALDMRASLEEAISEISPEPPTPLLTALEILDTRFLSHTVEDEQG